MTVAISPSLPPPPSPHLFCHYFAKVLQVNFFVYRPLALQLFVFSRGNREERTGRKNINNFSFILENLY
jgi:hypothetical protein